MRGFSLPEVLLSGTLMTILTAVLSLAWIQGARTWNYASRLSERFSQMTAVRHRLEKELINSNTLTVQASPDALTFHADPSYRLYWKAGTNLLVRDLPVPAEPLAACCTGGTVLLRDVSDFSVTLHGNVVHFELECSQVFYSDRERKVRLESTTLVRN